YVPENEQPFLKDVFPGFEFENIENDIFENSRQVTNYIGAFSKSSYSKDELFDLTSYGPAWFSPAQIPYNPKTIKVSSKNFNLINQKIKSAGDGDIIELEPGRYNIDQSIIIDKVITIKSRNSKRKAQLNFSGTPGISLFELHPKSHLKLENIEMTGSGKEIA